MTKYKEETLKAMEEGKRIARQPGGYKSMEELKKVLLEEKQKQD